MPEILSRQSSPDVASVIRQATRYLEGALLGYGHGTGSAIDDAAWLVLESAGQSPVEPPDYQQQLTVDQLEQCESWLSMRVEHRLPVAYIVGRTWFAGLEFKVDQRALVPRSPIAELIQGSYLGLIDTTQRFSLLDLCTGGGCIALASAHYMPNAMVTATDLSAAALALARENRSFLDLDHRVEFLQGDLFAPVQQRYDLIVSNPPYVDADDLASMPDEFQHEPPMGLGSGADGLDFTRRILAQAGDYLNPEGMLIVEVGNSAAALEKACPELPFEWFEFSHGGDGVFLLTRDSLDTH